MDGRPENPREALQSVQTLLDACNDGIILVGTDNAIAAVNNTMVPLLSIPFHGIEGMHMCAFLDTYISVNFPGRQDLIDRISDAMERGEHVEPTDCMVTTADGRELWMEYSSHYIETGLLKGTRLDQFHDISDKKNRELSLQEIEEVQDIIIGNLLEGVVIIDFEGTLLFANPVVAKMFGIRSMEELSNVSIYSFVNPEYHERVKRDQELVWAGKGGFLDTYEAKTVDGRNIWIECVGKKIRYRGIDANVVFIRDISDRIYAKEALISERKHSEEETKRHLRQLDVLHQIIRALTSKTTLGEILPFTLQKMLSLLDFNAGIIYLMDKDREEAHLHSHAGLPAKIVGQLPTEIKKRDLAKGSLRRVYEEGVSIFVDLGEMHESRYPLGMLLSGIGCGSMAIIPLKQDSMMVGFVILTRKQSQTFTEEQTSLISSIAQEMAATISRVALREDLERANNLANLYIDIMAHDINNANTAAIVYAEFLREMLSGEDREFAQKILISIRQSAEIINNISVMRRLESESSYVRPVRLDPVIRNEINHYQDVSIKYKGCNSVVMADELLSELITNLIGNSVKFGGPDVEIFIITKEKGNNISISIEDTGPGIPDEEKTVIFKRFHKGKTVKSGKGIGLYIAKTLVDRYGGIIYADDRVKGDFSQGAAIRITLPNALK
jgi:two-component system sensor histidine kinase KdpD